MAFKFEIIEKSLVITNTVSGDVALDIPKRDCYYYNPILLSHNLIKIIDTNAASASGAARFGCPLADAIDSLNIPFTESTFIEFARLNLANDCCDMGVNYKGAFGNYTDLITNFPSGNLSNAGRFGFVLSSEGAEWKPESEGGTYFGAGWWYDNGTEWINVNDDIYSELEVLNNNNGVVWKKEQIEGLTYVKNDWAYLGTWQGVANKTTTDLLEPQLVGIPSYSILDSDIMSEASDTSVVKTVHKFTLTEKGFAQRLEFHVPFFDLDSIARVTMINRTTGVAEALSNIILKSNEWVTVSVNSVPFGIGTQLEFWLEYYNTNSVANIIGKWKSNIGTGAPSGGKFNINNASNPTILEINHTDDDGGNRQVELDGVVVSSIITITETGDSKRNVTVEVTAIDTTDPSSTKYTTSLISNGDKDIRDNKVCTINIDTPLTKPSKYSIIPDYYNTNNPDWANITSELYFDGVLQAVSNTNAYGIRVLFQKASTSDDWDLLPNGNSGGTSSQIDKSITVTSDFTVTDQDIVYIDSALNSFTVTLPLTPILNTEIEIIDSTGSCGTNLVTVNGNGNLIVGETTALMESNFIGYSFRFNGTNWNLK